MEIAWERKTPTSLPPFPSFFLPLTPPPLFQVDDFPDPIKMVHDDVLLAVLGPGQEISLIARAVKGVCVCYVCVLLCVCVLCMCAFVCLCVMYVCFCVFVCYVCVLLCVCVCLFVVRA